MKNISLEELLKLRDNADPLGPMMVWFGGFNPKAEISYEDKHFYEAAYAILPRLIKGFEILHRAVAEAQEHGQTDTFWRICEEYYKHAAEDTNEKS